MSRYRGHYEPLAIDGEPVECEELGCEHPAVVDDRFVLCEYHTIEAYEMDAAEMMGDIIREGADR